VMSLYMLVFMGGTPLGSLIVGWITEAWGAPTALIISGGVCVVAAAVAALLAARSAGISIRLNLHLRPARQLASGPRTGH
jgi:predicted MFS family arabinose efflux permease